MNKDLCLLMFFYLHRKETIGMGCSQAVRQRVLIPCTVGSNPTTPAIIRMVHFVFKIVGIKSSRCLEYGCFGLSNNLSLFSNSQTTPFRITATLSHI